MSVEASAKACTKCAALKTLEKYYRDKRATDGRYSHCIDCHKILLKRYSKEHPEVNRAGTARYRLKNPGAGKEAAKLWRKNNSARVCELQRRYAKANPEKIRALVVVSSAKRKAMKLRAMPEWSNLEQIKLIYTEARTLTKRTGDVYHVDHIVPLISNLVCGLHVPENLQVILGVLNMSKQNRYWPDMP